MANVKIYYLLDEEGRKDSILKGGNGKMLQCLECESTEEIMKYCNVEQDGKCIVTVGFKADSKTIGDMFNYNDFSFKSSNETLLEYNYETKDDKYGEKPKFISIKKVHFFRKTQNIPELIIFSRLLDEKLKKHKEYFERIVGELQKQYNNDFESYERKQEELKKNRFKEKEEWIIQFGSQFLKDAIKEGYDCQRRYVTERAQKEFSDFILDFDKKYKYTKIACPSEEAFYQSVEINKKTKNGFSKVVWVLSDGNKDNKNFEESEGIVIDEYIDKYTIIKIMKS